MQTTFISIAPVVGSAPRGKAEVSTRRTPACSAATTRCAGKLGTGPRHTVIALFAVCAASTVALSTMSPALLLSAANAETGHSTDWRTQLKISGGSASTSGGSSSSARSVTKTVTRGVNLENAYFANTDFEGVSFQQSMLRQADFSNCVLRNASFFDADLTGAKFTNADMTNVNVCAHWSWTRVSVYHYTFWYNSGLRISLCV